MIEPKVLKGFRDLLPDKEIPRQKIQNILTRIFELSGFVPIDTPVLEYSEVLLGKGGGETDKQVYSFTDHGGRDVAMRFDLTVPFARYMATHFSELYLPFRRFHMAKVWRGENTQKGRYREFMQCDFDIVGSDSASADLEILLLMQRSLKAIRINDFSIRFSHRGVFNTLLERLNLKDKSIDILRIVDKIGKVGKEEIQMQLEILTEKNNVLQILDFIKPEDTNSKTLEKMFNYAGVDDPGIQRLSQILEYLSVQNNIEDENLFVLDSSITRGLDYYTGLVFETFLKDLPKIGSICSGGRYNDLASLYTKEKLPGVGASIGLDRLMAALEELKLLAGITTPTKLIILNLNEKYTGFYHKIAESFRNEKIPCEVFPEKKKISVQIKYAESKGIPYAVLYGEDEEKQGKINLKDLNTRESIMIDNKDFVKLFKIYENSKQTV